MYTVKKVSLPITDIFSPLWEEAEVAEIKCVNWKEFEYAPKTQARLLYSDFGIHIKFTTDEKPLCARETKRNGNVYLDSCMEFFFRPNENHSHYFTFEFNPLGTMYMSFRTSRSDFVNPENEDSYFCIKSHTDKEQWSLIFTVPFEFIHEYFGEHTKRFWGNMQKCGGATAHYLTLFPIATPAPDFHRPEFFGEFVLE